MSLTQEQVLSELGQRCECGAIAAGGLIKDARRCIYCEAAATIKVLSGHLDFAHDCLERKQATGED